MAGAPGAFWGSERKGAWLGKTSSDESMHITENLGFILERTGNIELNTELTEIY